MSADLSPDDLAAIRARAEAATPAPWVRDYIDGNDDDPFRRENVVHNCADVAVCTGWGVANAAVSAGSTHDEGVAIAARQAKADADFIAAARSDVPALLALVERLQGDVARVREVAYGCDPALGHQVNPEYRSVTTAAILAALDGPAAGGER